MKIFLLMTAVIVVIFIGSVQEGMAKAISSPEQPGVGQVITPVTSEQGDYFVSLNQQRQYSYMLLALGNLWLQAVLAATFGSLVAWALFHRQHKEHDDGHAHLFNRAVKGSV